MSLWTAEKRILALDGGGTRGIVSIAFLEQIETLLKAKSDKGNAFRLADHFDLIGGTSTGAIIAAALAIGMSVSDVRKLYERLAPRVFHRAWWRIPNLVDRFGSRPLIDVLASELGDMTLDDPRIRTNLAIIMKRVDTGSPWIVSNLPDQPYWNDREDGKRRGNRHYKLARLVRASTAAPTYFVPENIAISDDVTGDFIDGGVSPYNSPAIPLMMLATMRCYGLNWPLGSDKLSLISIGTGRHRHVTRRSRKPAFVFGARTLQGLIEDCQAESLMLMQWLSEPDMPWWLNRDLQDLQGDVLGGRPLLSFQRYDLMLEKEWLEEHFGRRFSEADVVKLRAIDNPSLMPKLSALAKEEAERQVRRFQ